MCFAIQQNSCATVSTRSATALGNAITYSYWVAPADGDRPKQESALWSMLLRHIWVLLKAPELPLDTPSYAILPFKSYQDDATFDDVGVNINLILVAPWWFLH